MLFPLARRRPSASLLVEGMRLREREKALFDQFPRFFQEVLMLTVRLRHGRHFLQRGRTTVNGVTLALLPWLCKGERIVKKHDADLWEEMVKAGVLTEYAFDKVERDFFRDASVVPVFPLYELARMDAKTVVALGI